MAHLCRISYRGAIICSTQQSAGTTAVSPAFARATAGRRQRSAISVQRREVLTLARTSCISIMMLARRRRGWQVLEEREWDTNGEPTSSAARGLRRLKGARKMPCSGRPMIGGPSGIAGRKYSVTNSLPRNPFRSGAWRMGRDEQTQLRGWRQADARACYTALADYCWDHRIRSHYLSCGQFPS